VGYSFVLVFALYNTWVFLIMHGKAKIFLVTVFYVLAVTICVARIIDIVVTFNYTDEPIEAEGIWYMYLVALYAKALMGVFQMASMSELTIQVKFSAEQISKEVANARLKKLYTIACIIAAVYCCVGVYDGINRKFVLYYHPDKDGNNVAYDIITPVVLFSIACGLTISVTVLFQNLKLYFPHHLKDEKRRVKTIFLVYTVAYFTRAIFFLVYIGPLE